MAALQAFIGLLILTAVIRGANTRQPGGPMWHVLVRAAGAAVAGWLIIAAGMSMIPPLTNLHVRVIEKSPGTLLLEVHGSRSGTCRFMYNDAFVYDIAGVVHGAAVVYRGAGAMANRPPGRQRFSDRVLYFRQEVEPIAVRFVAHHDCGTLWRDIHSDSGRLDLWQ